MDFVRVKIESLYGTLCAPVTWPDSLMVSIILTVAHGVRVPQALYQGHFVLVGEGMDLTGVLQLRKAILVGPAGLWGLMRRSGWRVYLKTHVDPCLANILYSLTRKP